MTTMAYFYDADTDTVRRYGAGLNAGERFDKEAHEWSLYCCRRSGCKWDNEITQEEAQAVLDRQCLQPLPDGDD